MLIHYYKGQISQISKRYILKCHLILEFFQPILELIFFQLNIHNFYLILQLLLHFYQKLKYIHDNPVEGMLVTNPEDYLFSSARNYADLDYLLEVIVEPQQLITVK